jgi:hypothetical protein
MLRLSLLLGFLLSASTAFAQAPPDWVREDMARMIGRWVADNSAYQNAEEPFDAYGIEWTWGLGEKHVRGRLFGLIEGEEAGTFWEFVHFWHPGEQRVMVYQFGGDGTVGLGALERLGEGRSELLQTFYRPDGAHWRGGHREEAREGERHSQSYDVSDDGIWTARRSYVWLRVE